MEQENKKLLLIDLSARLPYGVKVLVKDSDGREYTLKADYGDLFLLKKVNTNIKPYLRPMSSMTKEERKEYDSKRKHICDEYNRYCFDTVESIDWLNAHHFDYRGLIEKGLALEAPTDMYI